MTAVALDVNVLMEILLARQRRDSVLAALERHANDDQAVFKVSTVSVATLFYLAEKHRLPMARVEKLLREHEVFSVLPVDVDWALRHYKQDDFEDALQVAAASREDCAVFMTLDAGLAAKYKRHLDIQLIS